MPGRRVNWRMASTPFPADLRGEHRAKSAPPTSVSANAYVRRDADAGTWPVRLR
jgi:hypothetical protein